MKLPTKQPLKENIVVTSPEELQDLVREALSQSSGAFMKIFGRDSKGKYYVTVLFDRSKVLAAECLLVDEKKDLVGSEAVSVLKSLMKNPMVVDIYTLDELETKLSIADNVDVYAQTEKVPLSELFGVEVAETVPVTETAVEEKPAAETAPAPTPVKEEPKPKTPAVEKVTETESKAEKPAPAPKKVPKEPEIVVNFTGGKLPEKAFKLYAEALLKEAKRIKNLDIYKIEFDSNLAEGVAYLNVRIYGTSDGSSRDIEVAEKRMLHAVSKHAPIILREAEVKPIVKDVAVIINGEEVKPQEIVDREKKKTGKVTKDGRITLSVLEEVWPYFSAYARTVISEIERSGIKVDKAYFDVKGRREFEINLYAAVKSTLPKDEVLAAFKTTLNRHAKELSRSINKYITVHTVEVEDVSPKSTETAAVATTKPVSSTKAAEILAKKAELEKEVEKLLKEAGIDELAPLTEEKKKEAEETALKSKIEPALEALKARIHNELKLIPRVTFKWLKLNHEVKGNKVFIDVEASFIKESTGGLFGSFSGVADDRIKQDVAETIRRVAKEVGREYGLVINVRKLNVILR